MTYIFDGREFAKNKESVLKRSVLTLRKKGITPCLVTILIGDNFASKLYVGLKQKAAERIGINFKLIHLKKANRGKLLQMIKVYNQTDEVHGIMVQLPIPGIDSREEAREILMNILSEKDVDGQSGNGMYLAATVKAIMYAIKEARRKGCLRSIQESVYCVIGATGMVGSALVRELQRQDARVLKVNSKTANLKAETLKADLLVSVTGRPGIIKKDMIKPGAVMIDVGAPKPDAEESVREIASFITPVPGGIGPVTVICLMENTVQAAEKAKGQ